MADNVDGLFLEIIKEQMDNAVKLLESYIKEEIALYKASYTPTHYERTGAWEDSIFVSKPKFENNSVVITIGFNDKAMHKSVMNNGEMGDVSSIMERGVHWGAKKGFKENRFNNWDGTHYIKKAVNRFNSSNDMGIHIDVYIGEEKYI